MTAIVKVIAPTGVQIVVEAAPDVTQRYSGAFDDDFFDPLYFDTDEATFVPDTAPGSISIVND